MDSTDNGGPRAELESNSGHSHATLVANVKPENIPDERVPSAKDAISGVAQTAKQVLNDKFEAGAQRVTASIDTAVQAIRRTADEVGEHEAWLGAALRKSADGLQAASNSWAGGNLNRVIDDLGNFARRQPAIFLGATLAAGFVVARLGKAATKQSLS